MYCLCTCTQPDQQHPCSHHKPDISGTLEIGLRVRRSHAQGRSSRQRREFLRTSWLTRGPSHEHESGRQHFLGPKQLKIAFRGDTHAGTYICRTTPTRVHTQRSRCPFSLPAKLLVASLGSYKEPCNTKEWKLQRDPCNTGSCTPQVCAIT